ncbi:hypothetical protein MAQ5080_01834 [Marinomonas aquimarina]|uniref:Uncharacterized protein n=1 Tax=Marinomonas aquimarina TaxID=295068 RepID=A0A1A8TDU8_9GAMM|nr:hypothetical protein [Marinomonas aquimarina]SBS31032.1 hypothetical protein MAQ5080_01834 [Marinomonas aquimarina]
MLNSVYRRVALVTLVAAWSQVALAHFPFVECTKETPDIVCLGGFSDGSSAQGVTIDLISYDEEIIASKTFDDHSRVQFEPYDGEFYILLDAGPGHTVEVDWNEISAR